MIVAKSPDAFRTISEVATWLGTQAHVLRFWESKFDAVSPVQRTGGRRYYRLEDMLLLGGIKFLLHEQGMTIKAVQNLLKEQGVAHVQSFSPPILSASKQKDPPTQASQPKDAAPAQNVVDLQFDPVKLSQSVLRSAREERAEDGDQLLLFPELAEAPPPPQTEVTPMRPDPAPIRALGTDCPAEDAEINSFPSNAGLITQALRADSRARRAALRASPDLVDRLRALHAKMSA
ncbi:MerR family transcriptional regulator [uncultured Planktomarina sp.]|uniref:MerR family transcriptional regulator n=1 Tax=uncultured Planktomarina sp. TaxID=1538529 RepID=UPI00326172C2